MRICSFGGLPVRVVQERRPRLGGKPGSIAGWVRVGGLGHAIRRSSPTNALQAILFRSHARLFRS